MRAFALMVLLLAAAGSVPAGARVSVDGAEVGVTPMAVSLDNTLGHEIELSAPGYTASKCYFRSAISIGWLALDIVLGIFPALVDAVTGDWRNLSQSDCHLQLAPERGAPSRPALTGATGPGPEAPAATTAQWLCTAAPLANPPMGRCFRTPAECEQARTAPIDGLSYGGCRPATLAFCTHYDESQGQARDPRWAYSCHPTLDSCNAARQSLMAPSECVAAQ